MPRRIKYPDPDALLAESGDLALYAKDLNEDAPLYRGAKLISAEPLIGGRRSFHLAWHLDGARLSRGGDSWLILKHKPGVHEWITRVMADAFPLGYLTESLGLSSDEVAALVNAEREKYPPK